MPGLDPEQAARVRVSDDRMTAWLVTEPGIDAAALSDLAIEGMAVSAGVATRLIPRGTIAEALKTITAHPNEAHEIVLLRGTPPVHGVHGRFDFEPGMLDEPAPPSTDHGAAGSAAPGTGPGTDHEDTDHYSRSAFTVVRQGQLIGRITAATEGEHGTDVKGGVLAAKPGRSPGFSADSTVTIDGLEARAAHDGVLIVRGDSIRVAPALHINDNVDFGSGNIDFTGDVLVERGVADGFVVKCTGDLFVRLLVQASELIVGGSATLRHGMAGRDKGSITTGLDLAARHLTTTRVRVGRDLQLTGELNACDTTIGRACPSGRAIMIGGTLMAAQRVELAEAGSEGRSDTRIMLGRMPDVERVLARMLELIGNVDRQIQLASERLSTLRSALARLTPAQAEELTEFEFALAEWQTRRGPVVNAAIEAARVLRENTRAELVVHRVIHPGVRITIGAHTLEATEPIAGPLLLTLNAKGEPEAQDRRDNSTLPASKIMKVATDAEGQTRARALAGASTLTPVKVATPVPFSAPTPTAPPAPDATADTVEQGAPPTPIPAASPDAANRPIAA